MSRSLLLLLLLLAVPASADAALFARLDQNRRQTRLAPDRKAQRAPLGGALRHRVSVGAMIAVAVLAVVVGTILAPTQTPEVRERVVEAVLEDGALYIVDPGVTVEADRETDAEAR